MKTTPLVLLGYLLIICTIGCGRKPASDHRTLPGSYVAKYSHGTETLVLNSDGTYKQKYVSNGQTDAEVNSGRWTYGETGGGHVYLDESVFFDNRSNSPQIPRSKGGHSLNIKLWRGGMIELVINDEDGLGYRKQVGKTVPDGD